MKFGGWLEIGFVGFRGGVMISCGAADRKEIQGSEISIGREAVAWRRRGKSELGKAWGCR